MIKTIFFIKILLNIILSLPNYEDLIRLINNSLNRIIVGGESFKFVNANKITNIPIYNFYCPTEVFGISYYKYENKSSNYLHHHKKVIINLPIGKNIKNDK